MNSGEGIFLVEEYQFNRCIRNNGNTKLPRGTHHSNNCYGQDPQLDAKIHGQQFEKKQNISIG